MAGEFCDSKTLLLPAHVLMLNRQPYTAAWVEILSSPGSYKGSKLSAMFDQSRLSLFEFSELHRAYLGVSGVNFSTALEAIDRNLIDSVDGLSMTTLSWAALKGDENALSCLLACGADPNRPDAHGRTPLHFAVYSGSSGCVEQLVAAKGRVDAKNVYGKTPLTQAIGRIRRNSHGSFEWKLKQQ